jgi:retinol dehydrogenase 12
LSVTHLIKVLNLLFVRALADRLGNIPVIVNAVDPGYAISELRRNVHGLRILVFYLMDLFLAIPTEKSSRRLVWGALGGKEDEDKLRGAYLRCSQVSEPSDFVISHQGREVQERTWVSLL